MEFLGGSRDLRTESRGRAPSINVGVAGSAMFDGIDVGSSGETRADVGPPGPSLLGLG